MANNISIIIPVYKEIPDSLELISLKQCLKILNRYTLTFVAPDRLNISYYVEFADQWGVRCKTEIFDDSFFCSIKGYNKLMLSQEFYNRFLQYDYILIYQLDCFVFRDELEYWCDLGYDYIGAPWFEKFDTTNKYKNLFGVGNGGFSLRKPASLLNILQRHNFAMSPKGILSLYADYSFLKKIIRLPLILIRMAGYKNNKSYYLKESGFNEDIIWGYVIKYIKKTLKIPDCIIASRFSYDGNPRILYQLNSNILPFGCHAWYTYKDNMVFWRAFIEKEGYNVT